MILHAICGKNVKAMGASKYSSDSSMLLLYLCFKLNGVMFTSFNGRRKRDLSNNIMINLTIYDNAVQFLNDTVGLSTSLSTLSLVSAKVSNQFATGQLQESAIALFNVSLVSLNIRPPQSAPNAIAASIGQVNKLNVIQQASGCSAQVPCQVQPILQLVDQNVIYFHNFLVNGSIREIALESSMIKLNF